MESFVGGCTVSPRTDIGLDQAVAPQIGAPLGQFGTPLRHDDIEAVPTTQAALRHPRAGGVLRAVTAAGAGAGVLLLPAVAAILTYAMMAATSARDNAAGNSRAMRQSPRRSRLMSSSACGVARSGDSDREVGPRERERLHTARCRGRREGEDQRENEFVLQTRHCRSIHLRGNVLRSGQDRMLRPGIAKRR